jgi:pimeloyl-ACP methyl ester carboxylesterase
LLAARGYRVFALDLIGFGASSQPGYQLSRPLDNRLWGRQVIGFVQEVVRRPCVLIGNSLGGLTALTAALLQPELVQAVVAAPLPDPALMQPVPRRRPPGSRRRQRRLVVGLLRLLPLELIVPLISRTPLLRAGLQGAYRHSVAGDRELLQLIAAPARRSTAARSLRAMSIGMALRPRGATAPALLGQLNGRLPLLLVWGRQDRFVPLAIGQTTANRHPWLSLRVIDGTGHCPHDETPDDFLQAVLPWLDRSLGESSPATDEQRR